MTITELTRLRSRLLRDLRKLEEFIQTTNWVKVNTHPSMIEAVIMESAQAFQVSREALMSNTRTEPTVTARQVAMYLLRRHSDLTLSEIARIFRKQDHATVMHACSKVYHMRRFERKTGKIIDALDTRFESAAKV